MRSWLDILEKGWKSTKNNALYNQTALLMYGDQFSLQQENLKCIFSCLQSKTEIKIFVKDLNPGVISKVG